MEFVDGKNLFKGNRFLIFGCGIAAIGFLKSYKISPNYLLGFVESKSSMNKFSGGGAFFNSMESLSFQSMKLHLSISI